MNSLKIKKILNILIFLILFIQLMIIYYNSKISPVNIQKKNITIENFSSILLSKYGVTYFGSEKLSKKDEINIFLEGLSYLENDFYKIYGKDIHLNVESEISYSDKPVKTINSMGTMKASGFKNDANIGKIYFLGDSIFNFND